MLIHPQYELVKKYRQTCDIKYDILNCSVHIAIKYTVSLISFEIKRSSHLKM